MVSGTVRRHFSVFVRVRWTICWDFWILSGFNWSDACIFLLRIRFVQFRLGFVPFLIGFVRFLGGFVPFSDTFVPFFRGFVQLDILWKFCN